MHVLLLNEYLTMVNLKPGCYNIQEFVYRYLISFCIYFVEISSIFIRVNIYIYLPNDDNGRFVNIKRVLTVSSGHLIKYSLI